MNILLDRLNQRIEKGDFISFANGVVQAYEVVDTGDLVQKGPGGIPMRTIRLISKVAINVPADAPNLDAYKIAFRIGPPPSNLS